MKRLLLCAVSALFAFSANAIQKGDYVYTPQGRFLITGTENLMGTAGSFANLDGWTVVTAGENTVLADNFTVGTDGDMGYAQSVRNTVDEGMKYTTSSLDASNTYVISYKMRNAVEAAPVMPLTTSLAKNSYVKDGANVVLITGVSTADATDVVTYNQASETTTDWVTYCYTIVGDGTARTLSINLNSMATSLQIADIQILEAKQVADDRDAQAKAAHIMSIWKLTDWSKYDDELTEIYPAEDLVMAYGQVAKITEDMHDYLAGYLTEDEIKEYCPGFNEDLKAYTSQLSTYSEKLSKFMQTQMTAYIDVTADGGVHLGYQSGYNQQKYTVLGTWNVVSPGGRGYWRKGWPDLGHYGGSQKDFTVAELSKEFELFEGGYIFKADMVGFVIRSTSSNDWDANLGLGSDDGFVYVTDAEGNVVASSDTTCLERDINGDWTTKTVAFNVPADGKYTMHIKSNRRFATNGGQVHVRWPELYGKSFGQYSAEEKQYIAAVQAQITAGDNAYAEALKNIDSTFVWGKATLQACVDTMSNAKATWDAIYDQEDAIVATYDKDVYEEGATNPKSLMVYEVYSSYVKDLLAANRTIKAVNDTLNLLAAKIADAEDLNTLTIYQVSSGKAALDNEIATAKQLDATLRASDYSLENAQAIRDEITALENAMTELKNGIDPAKYTTVYADIDFSFTEKWDENITEYTEEGAAATIKGKVGSIEVSSFKKVTEAGEAFPYELGIDAEGGYKDNGDMLRVGGSDASVAFTASDLGKNVLLVSMDWWFSRLDNAFVGFEVLDEDGNRIAGLQNCQYNSTRINYDSFNIADRMGQFYAAINKDNKDLIYDGNHTNWLAVLDFVNAKQYLIATVPSGTVFSDPVDMNIEGTPATFKITATGFKKYPGRRSWFDNLKIQKLEGVTPTAINDAQAASVVAAKPTKRIVKGQLVIEKNGKFFDAVGKRIK